MAPLCASYRPVMARGRDVREGWRHMDISIAASTRAERVRFRISAATARSAWRRHICVKPREHICEGRVPSRWTATPPRTGPFENSPSIRRGGRSRSIRSSKYLNNLIEQDHRAIKSRIGPMLGFKDFVSAQITLAGVELLHRIRQGQFALRKLGVAKKTAPEIWNAVLGA